MLDGFFSILFFVDALNFAQFFSSLERSIWKFFFEGSFRLLQKHETISSFSLSIDANCQIKKKTIFWISSYFIYVFTARELKKSKRKRKENIYDFQYSNATKQRIARIGLLILRFYVSYDLQFRDSFP